MEKINASDKKTHLYNIIIRDTHVIYNTKTIFNNDTVKIPSYIISDIIKGNKTLLLKHNHEVTLGYYTTSEVKEGISFINAKVYNGVFKKSPIEYNLVNFKI